MNEEKVKLENTVQLLMHENNTLSCEVEAILVQPEQNIAGAVMPNGVCVSNVYDAYEAGRASVLLAQPERIEQEPKLDIYKDIFEDYKYLLTAFKNGADANNYSREIHQAESDIRKACNWLFPLPTNVIDDLAQKAFYAGSFDFRAFARELEGEHGIGADNE
jgi:hypothetical protein